MPESTMTESDRRIAGRLETLRSERGTAYLKQHPYLVALLAREAAPSDPAMAGALFSILLCNVRIPERMDTYVQRLVGRCGLSTSLAQRAAGILFVVTRPNHTRDRRLRNERIFKELLAEDLTVLWEGRGVWDGGSCTVDCDYRAELVIHPTERIREAPRFADELQNRELPETERLQAEFVQGLKDELDEAIEAYCGDDDPYYPPVGEDFDAEYVARGWAKRMGFEVVSFSGRGETGDYEPKDDYRYRRRW